MYVFTVHQHYLGHTAPKTGKMISNLKQHSESKPPHLLELRDAYTVTPIVTSSAAILMLKGNPSNFFT
jgi:hypothetical protein